MAQENDTNRRQTISLVKVKHTNYFRDNVRKIDAILVYDSSKNSEARNTFLNNLKQSSLELEYQQSAYKESIIYVKVHAPRTVLEKQAIKHGIPLKFNQLLKLPEPSVPHNCLLTILNNPHPNPEDPIAKRAWKTISKEKPTDFTTCERSTIVFTMMHYSRFGTDPFDIGLSQLILHGDFIAAYPLHDGRWKWPKDDSEPLNDRQLLAKYWANFSVWNKQQPLNTIEQYFGPEIAMYFGWLGFYNKMLIYASIMGILTFLYGVIHLNLVVTYPIKEACESDLYICPYCQRCKPKKLKKFCWYFKIAHLNDNIASVLFAFTMSFWATTFMEFWKRQQTKLELRWNLNKTIDDVPRPEFQAHAPFVRTHKYTGELELFIPFREKVINYSVSISVVIFMILIVLTTIVAIIIYEVALKMYGVEKAYITLSSSFMTLCVMVALRKIYGLIAMCLTSAECPRTQLEFDKSYMIKMIVFSLVNSYGKLVYIAFFKGKFFTYPGDHRFHSQVFPLSTEICDPTGCVSEIFVLLATITVFKPVFMNIVEVITPIIKIWIHKVQKITRIKNINLETWEQDFDLNTNDHFRIMDELEEMVMQYGFVTLLVAAFPLAPLLALINNIFEVRIDATKVVKYFRRAETVKSTSIHVWFDTLQAVTYLAIVTNALFITFTSNFIPSMIYYTFYKKNMKGFFAFELSKYRVEDNFWFNTNITECWYTGHRYPPSDKNAYQYTYLHFYILSWRLGFAIFFLLFVLGLTGIIAYAIPDIPESINGLLAYNERKLREKESAA